jgi:dethiobiotin synthetase
MPTLGLFITGTDTGVGKTYVAAVMARALAAAGRRVGVYKPVASGCWLEGDELVSDDARTLWLAAGKPGELAGVSPQRFAAAVAPNVAARLAGQVVDAGLLRSGVEYWRERSEFVLVEGAGGLLSPAGDADLVADLARDFGYPLVIVARNALGTINHTLLTAEAARQRGLPIAAIVLNDGADADDDPSRTSNFDELAARLAGDRLLRLSRHGRDAIPAIDWGGLA